MRPVIFTLIGGLLISQFITSATRVQRLAKGKRFFPPLPIILLCLWGIVGNMIIISQLIRTITTVQGLQAFVTYGTLFSAVISTVCFIGYALMKKWGVIGYTTIFVIMQITLISIGAWSPSAGFLAPILFIVIGFANFPEMT